MKQPSIRKLTAITGRIGVGTIVVASIITAIPYRGTKGEFFSPFNHFISELGQRGVSESAPVFNTGLIIGGLFLALFMLGLGLYFKRIYAYAASAVGIVCGIACSLVGVFPMNNMAVHVKVAMTFFRGGLIAILLFTVIIIFDRQKKISRWMMMPGIITVLAFALFLYLPKILEPGMGVTLSVPAVRPAIWLNPSLEWLVFITVLAWISSISTALFRIGNFFPSTLFRGRSRKGVRSFG